MMSHFKHRLSKWKRSIGYWFHRIRHRQMTTGEWLRVLWGTVFGGFVVFFIGTACVLVFLFFISRDLPTTDELVNFRAVESTKIFDRYGGLLYEVHGDQRRTNVTLDEISPYLVQATLAAEDDEFYEHPGYDWKGITRSVIANVESKVFGGSGRVQGASTITQQLVRNAWLSREKTFTRKAKELLLSMQVEKHFTKDQILEMYLNTVSYGSNVYGVQTAAQAYFGKDASMLTLGESAVLAAMVQRPSYYSPYGSHVDELFARRDNYVLQRMENLGLISNEERLMAVAEVPTFLPYYEEIKAPHFVFYVKELLETKYGSEMVEQGGLQVYTTIDPTMQDIADTSISEQAAKNAANYTSNNMALVSMNPKNGDVLAMVGSSDYFNQEIHGQVNVAMSQRQPGSSFKPFVYANAFLAGFGPGTVVYDVKTNFGNYDPENYDGKARGPVTLRYALGQSLNIPAVKVFHLGGPTQTLTLARSMGITTVDGTQAESLGLAAALGVAEVRPFDMAVAYGAFAQGGKKVTPRAILRIEDRYGKVLEEIAGYLPPSATSGSGSEIIVPDPVDRAADPALTDGPSEPAPRSITSLYELIPAEAELMQRDQVLDEQAAYLINNILSDTTVKLSQNLILGDRPAATKTGTANKKNKNNVNVPSDTWTVGYTPSLVTVVWAGNTDGAALNPYADGVNLTAPAWKSFMNQVLKGQPVEEFVKPADIKSVAVSKISGFLPSAQTPSNLIHTELWASYGVPTIVDQGVTSAVVDSISGKLANEYTPEYAKVTYLYENHHDILFYINQEDPQFSRWEPPVRKWAIEDRPRQILEMAGVIGTDGVLPIGYVPGEVLIDGKRYKYVSSLDEIPTEFDDVHTSDTHEGSPRITVLQPVEGGRMAPGENDVLLEVTGDSIDRVEVYFDGTIQDVLSSGRYEKARVTLPDTIAVGSAHQLAVYAYNRVQDRSVVVLNVIISSDATPPELDLRSPNDRRSFKQGETIEFDAVVTDEKSGVREVEFILDGRPLKIFTAGPFIFEYLVPNDLAPGDHSLVVRAFDNESNVSRIDQILEIRSGE